VNRTLVRALTALFVAIGVVTFIPATAAAQGLPWHPWQSQPLTPFPPSAEAHNWDSEIVLDPTAPSAPIDLLGSADIAVRRLLALPHWTTTYGPPTSTTGYIGSVKSTGTVGSWDVYFNIYDLDFKYLGIPISYPFRCEYHAQVTGTYRNPIVTQLSPPNCGYYRPR
jgi:hypothetical protein